jgi:hypothetical protein
LRRADGHDDPLGGVAVEAHRKDAEVTHATHKARLVTGVRASGRRAESFRSVARFALLRTPTAASGQEDAAFAMDNASRAPVCRALALNTSHAARPSGVPEENPRAAAR